MVHVLWPGLAQVTAAFPRSASANEKDIVGGQIIAFIIAAEI